MDIVERINEVNKSSHWSCVCSLCEEAADEIEKLRAEVQELRAKSEWQPIETAPKNGTEILITDGVDIWTAVYLKSNIQNYSPFFAKSSDNLTLNVGAYWESEPDYIYKPTHWRPLPEAPEGE